MPLSTNHSTPNGHGRDEVIPLLSTEADRIAQELLLEKILSDQWANFMSALLKDVYQCSADLSHSHYPVQGNLAQAQA